MSLIRLYTSVLDQDHPRLTGDARRVVCEIVVITGNTEKRVAVFKAELGPGEEMPVLDVQQQAGPPRIRVLSQLGAVLYDSNP